MATTDASSSAHPPATAAASMAATPSSVPSSVSEGPSSESPFGKNSSRDGMSEISNGDVCVLVCGGGMAGICSALALAAAGCEVHVYEESPDGFSPSSEVGVPLTEELQSFCKQHGVELDKRVARSTGRTVLADDGECAVQDDKQQDFVSWDSLKRAMLEKVPADHYHANCKVVAADLSDPSSAAVIELESGERIAGHLIIAADGLNSTLRHQLLPKCQPTYAGYLAWRGVARVDELSGEVQHLLAGKTTMYKGPYLHVQVHPLPPACNDASSSSDGGSSSSDGSRRLAWTWFNNQMEEELSGLLLDTDLDVHAHSVPIGLINPAVADAVAAAAANALPPPLAELVSCSTRHMGVTAISDMVLSGCVISHKVAFVGKAGSVVRPHCCSAAHKAVLDAVSLAEALRGSKLALEKALPRWEQQQVQRNLALCHEAVAAGERMQGFAAC